MADRKISVDETRRTFLSGGLVGVLGGVAGATVFHAVGHLAFDHDSDTPSSDSHSRDTHDSDTGHLGVHADVDIGFCTDMTAHHLQAVIMCERVLGRDTGDPVQAAATEVIRNQSIEIGMMRAWLADWDAPTTSPERVMAWMADHQSMTSMAEGAAAGIPLAEMPGYATDDQLAALSTTSGLDKGRLWLELMRAHHVGGVAMAEAAADLSSSEKVVRLATTQAEVQSWEIGQYDLLLSSVYA